MPWLSTSVAKVITLQTHFTLSLTITTLIILFGQPWEGYTIGQCYLPESIQVTDLDAKKPLEQLVWDISIMIDCYVNRTEQIKLLEVWYRVTGRNELFRQYWRWLAQIYYNEVVNR